MKRNKYIFLTFIVALIVIALIKLFEEGKKQSVEIINLGPVPPKLVELLDPKEEIYMVNFFASWCSSCAKEHPELLYLKKKEKIKIYGLALRDNKEDLGVFLRKYGNPFFKLFINYPVEEIREIRIMKIPRTLIIYQGAIIYDHEGEINNKILHNRILPIIDLVQSMETEKRKKIR